MRERASRPNIVDQSLTVFYFMTWNRNISFRTWNISLLWIFIFSYITYLVGNSSTCPLGNLANKLLRKRIKTSDKIKKLATYFTNWIHCYKFLKCFIINLHKKPSTRAKSKTLWHTAFKTWKPLTIATKTSILNGAVFKPKQLLT